MKTRCIVLAVFLSVAMLPLQSAFAEPPPDFLAQCKKATRLYRMELVKRGKSKETYEELKAIRKGKLFAPELKGLRPGAIGRPRLLNHAATVLAVHDSQSATVVMPRGGTLTLALRPGEPIRPFRQNTATIRGTRVEILLVSSTTPPIRLSATEDVIS